MVCQFCSKKATVFVTQITDGQLEKLILCEGCAREKKITDPTGLMIADQLLQGLPELSAPPQETLDACPNCGFTLVDLKKIRRLGCSECYRVFFPECLDMVRGMQFGVEHVGKKPLGRVARMEKAERRTRLEGKLQAAVKAEQFEEAAKLRDLLKELDREEDQGDSSGKEKGAL